MMLMRCCSPVITTSITTPISCFASLVDATVLSLTTEHATSISADIDGGLPWRRTFGENITYTDWSHDNYFHAVRKLVGAARRIGIEYDHVNIDLLNLLKSEFPKVDFVDVATPAMKLWMIKSDEEIAHIRDDPHR